LKGILEEPSEDVIGIATKLIREVSRTARCKARASRASRASKARASWAAWPSCAAWPWSSAFQPLLAILVVNCPLVWVTQYVKSLGDFLEFLLSLLLLVLILVRMPLEGRLPVCLLDVVLLGIPTRSKDGVVISPHVPVGREDQNSDGPELDLLLSLLLLLLSLLLLLFKAMATPKYKVVLLGEQSVGKTSLIVRYLKNTFYDKVDATIGMDFQSKTVTLGDRSIRLQLWDTAGQERFRSLVNSYIRDAAAAVVVFDLTKRESFDSSTRWVDEVRSARGDDALIFLVGNKADAAEQRQVSTEDGQRRAKDIRAVFMETSAKTGDNVPTLFQQLAEALPQRPPGGGGAGGSDGIQLNNESLPKDGASAEDRKAKGCQC